MCSEEELTGLGVTGRGSKSEDGRKAREMGEAEDPPFAKNCLNSWFPSNPRKTKMAPTFPQLRLRNEG
jgi:hypothetical protein